MLIVIPIPCPISIFSPERERGDCGGLDRVQSADTENRNDTAYALLSAQTPHARVVVLLPSLSGRVGARSRLTPSPSELSAQSSVVVRHRRQQPAAPLLSAVQRRRAAIAAPHATRRRHIVAEQPAHRCERVGDAGCVGAQDGAHRVLLRRVAHVARLVRERTAPCEVVPCEQLGEGSAPLESER
eukprot:7391058-Prymnesium_polylepis.1